jgi:EmrB/QacA subfamily drug resistance transporter
MEKYVIGDVRRQRTMMAVVCFGALMANMDGTIVNVCLPTIANGWNLSPSYASLIVLAYLLFETGPIMAFGKLGDLFGGRRVFLGGFVLFTAASLLCGMSGTFWQLVAMRMLQGIGGSMMFSVMLTFAAIHVPLAKRGRAMGYTTMAAALGVAIGPPVGGIIAHYLGWRHIFFINVPLGLIAMLVGFRVLPKTYPAPRDSRFDTLGAVYQTLFLLAFVFALNQGAELGWTSPLIAGSLVCSVVIAALFVRRELRIDYPILDLRLFANRDTLFSTLNFCLSMMVFGGILFIFPFYLQDIRNMTVNIIGLVMCVLSVGQFLGPYAGQLGDRKGHKSIALAGVGIGLVAFTMFTLMDYGEPLWWVVLALTVFGLSQGLNRAPNIQLIMGSVSVERKNTAASLTSLMRSLGLVLGVVVFETTFSRFIPDSLSLDAVSLKHSGISPERLHEGFEVTLLVGLAISVLMVALIAAVRGAPKAE